MTTLDNHADIPVELALQLEGAAILEEKSTAEFLEGLLDRYAKKTRRNRETQVLRELIRERNSQGYTDVEIAQETGVSQQAITRQRTDMGLTRNHRLKTHCKRGHPLEPGNIYAPPSRPTERTCLTCKRSARL